MVENSPKIEVCEYCSGIDVKKLKSKAKIKIACIGKCSKKFPELAGKAYGFLNGEFIVCDTEKEFFAKAETLGDYVATSKQNQKVDAFLSTVNQWNAEFDALRAILLESELSEDLKWGQPCYLFKNANVAILGAFKDYIALSFFKGALLKDDKKLLVQQTENVQAGRQLRFTNIEQINDLAQTIKEYIADAVQVEISGAKVPVAPKKEMPLPDELEAAFLENPAFKDAFYALTPGRQRGYLFHFNGAKQSQTRIARIEKNMPKIFDGKGIDD